MQHSDHVFTPKHREVPTELLHIDDKVLERLTAGGIPRGHASLDGEFHFDIGDVIHGVAQCPEDRSDAGIGISPRGGCSPPRSPSPPGVGGVRLGVKVTPPVATALPPAGVVP